MGFLPPRPLVVAATVLLFVPRFLAEPFDEPGHFDRVAEANGWVRDRDARDDEHVLLQFWLKQTHLAELKELLKNVSDPTSPDYGHYLTKEQVDALTAPLKKNVAVVVETLHGYNTHKQNKGAVISAKVPISFAERTLGGNFVYYCRRAPTGGPDLQLCALRNPTAQVPALLRAVCDFITPLDDPLAPPLSPPVVTSSQADPDNSGSGDSLGGSGVGSAGIFIVGIVAAFGLIAAAIVVKRAQRGSWAAPLLVAE